MVDWGGMSENGEIDIVGQNQVCPENEQTIYVDEISIPLEGMECEASPKEGTIEGIVLHDTSIEATNARSHEDVNVKVD